MSGTGGYEVSGKRLPFYMMFPFSDNIDAEEEEEKDLELLKSLYPIEARRIWPEVEDACDQLEYSGSILFDEYPDRSQVRRQVNLVEERLEQGGLKRPDSKEEHKRRQDLIEMIFYQEMHRRRRRRRRFLRHFIY